MKTILNPNEKLEDLQLNNLYIIQSDLEYRFTSDAVALANFVHVSNFGRVVDLCSGSGVVGILVNAKNRVKDVTLVEIQQTLADMSLRSCQYNKLDNIRVVNQKLQGISKVIGEGVYDVVTCNPPYQKQNSTLLLSEKPNIAICKHEIMVTLEEIILEAGKLLKFGGSFFTVNKEDRLVDIICLCRKYNLETKEIKVIKSTKGSNIVLVKAKKGGKSGVKISL